MDRGYNMTQLIVKKKNETDSKPSAAEVREFADRIISFDGENFDVDSDEIKLENSKWSLKRKASS